MTYGKTIKRGVQIINRNWQLVLIQLGVVFTSSIGFFIIVGIPLAVAFIIFGVDLTGIADFDDIITMLKGPSEILSKYFGLILVIIASFLMYLILVTLLGIYAFGGSIGIVAKSIRDESSRFHIKTFFEEARRHFVRLLVFTSFVGVIFIVTAFVFGILGGGFAALVSYAKSEDSTLALFFGTFFSVVMIAVAAFVILCILSISLYGIACLTFNEIGPLASARAAGRFLLEHPQAFWLSVVLFLGYLFASFLLVLFSYPFTLIPVIGTILSFPYQLVSYAFETYLGLVIIAAMLNFYYATTVRKGEAETGVERSAEQIAAGEGSGAGNAETVQQERSPNE